MGYYICSGKTKTSQVKEGGLMWASLVKFVKKLQHRPSLQVQLLVDDIIVIYDDADVTVYKGRDDRLRQRG